MSPGEGDSSVKIFDILPPAWDRLYRRSDQVHPFRITFQNFSLPAASIKVQNGVKLECELRITLFDITYKQFFGKTWVAPKLEVRASSPTKDVNLFIDKNVCFHTSFADQNIVLAIEFNIVDSSNTDNPVVSSGWTFLRVFQPENEVKDVSDVTPSQSMKLYVYDGSPRALLFLEEPLESNKHLQKIIGCELQYQVMTHAAMLKVLHLIPENVLIGGNEHIPGLTKDPKSNDCLRKIKIDKGIVLDLNKVVLLCDNIEKFEDELCHLMNEDRRNRENMSPDGSELTVFERRLQIGVHNGWNYVQEPQIHHLVPDAIVNPTGIRSALKPDHPRSGSIVSKLSNSASLVLRNRVRLTEVPDKCFIVFLLEYILSFPMPTIDNRRPSSSASVGRGTTMAVAAAWCSWAVPARSTASEVHLSLHGGPSYNFDSLLLYRSRQESDNESMKISFLCSAPAKAASHQDPPVSEGYADLFHHNSEDEMSLQDEIPPPVKRPASASARSHRKLSMPRSPVKQPAISSPSKSTTQRSQKEQMPEVPYSSSPHLPIIPVLSEKKTSPNPQVLSRAGYAHLYSTGFPTILDRHGKPPHVVDFYSNLNISMDKEHSDPMKCNEIIIEFLALSGSPTLSNGQLIYLTFQFYRFPLVKTDKLLLNNFDHEGSTQGVYPYVLYKTNKDGSKLQHSDPGFQIKYDVDTQFLYDDGEMEVFLKYLKHHTMFINIWDAQSLFHIGTASIPLKYLCRQSKNAIQVICELDVIKNNCRSSTESSQAVDVDCLLHVRLANVGRQMDPAVMKQQLSKSSKDENQVQLLQPLIEEDRQLVNLLKLYSTNTKSNDHMTEERQRKLARMDAVRSKKGLPHPVQSNDLTNQENKLNMLKIIDQYRNKHKDEIIRSVLCKSITKSYTLYPMLGNAYVILHPLVNHSEQSQTVIVECPSPDIRVVTNYSEWLHMKDIHSFVVNLEEDMFSVENDKVKLFMRPNEKVIIPFKYQQLALGHELIHHINDSPKTMITEGANHKVTVSNCSTGKLISVINFIVHPQPISCDQFLTFHHPENSFFKTFLQIPSDVRGQLSVRCTDKNLICGIENSDNTCQKCIYVKVAGGAADNVKTFFLMLFNDRFCSQVIFSWKIVLYVMQKIDVCCTQGQTCRTSLVLRGQQTTKLVRTYSSDAKLMAVEPGQVFILPAGALQEIHIGIRVMQAGSRNMQVNIVDEENSKYVKSWLVYVRTDNQTISKAFQVNLPVGGAKAAKKRVKFTNPYPVKKTFTVQTNQSDLLQIKDNKFELDAGESYSLGLYFLPSQKRMTAELLVFVNNSKDENEETFCIRAVFS